jgi:hypothetical protein
LQYQKRLSGALGGYGNALPSPPPLGHPPYCDSHSEGQREIFLKKKHELKGVKGVHPLGCLPLRGREGVTLIIPNNLFLQQPHKQRLLGMEPVLRFVPDQALAAFHHFVRDLLATVRWQAVQDPCTG